ncbi:MAG TPA: ATP-binding cassette domain-containing protein, partial [Candidatus Agrococcus pullicola]|nr:ATP-binding cassette domain-containing protein [Candidatus Agrococcus pullicola]
ADSGDLVQDGDGSGIGVTRFTGTYTDYLQARKDALARWEQQFADEQAKLKKLRASVSESQTVGRPERGPRTEARSAKKFYADRNAKVVARRVGDTRSRLEELEERQIRKPPRELSFAGIPLPARSMTSARTVIDAAQIALAGRLERTSLSIRQGEQWLVTGSNGTGKSTLLQVLAGALEPTSGSVQRARGLRIGLLTQHADIPDPHDRGPSRTLVRAYEDAVGSGRATAVPLTAFGLFAPRDLQRPLDSVSRGQVQRLALAIVLAEMPDVLLLDEPTNHLSLLLVTQLEESLADYPGTVVIASHDRWLRSNWAGRTLQLEST